MHSLQWWRLKLSIFWKISRTAFELLSQWKTLVCCLQHRNMSTRRVGKELNSFKERDENHFYIYLLLVLNANRSVHNPCVWRWQLSFYPYLSEYCIFNEYLSQIKLSVQHGDRVVYRMGSNTSTWKQVLAGDHLLLRDFDLMGYHLWLYV